MRDFIQHIFVFNVFSRALELLQLYFSVVHCTFTSCPSLFILFSILSHNFSSHWNFCRILSISEYSNQWYQFYGILMSCFYFTIKYNYTGLYYLGFPGSTSGKEPAWQCRRPKRRKFDSWVWRSPREENGHLFQYSCPENPMDREA